MSYIFLVRHGDTRFNRQKRYQGTSDLPLSSSGIKKVRALRSAIGNLRPHGVYSSALQRTVQTASILMRSSRDCRIDRRLNEMDFGDWEGKTAQELLDAKDRAYSRFLNGEWPKPTGGESMQEVQARVRLFWKECLNAHQDQDVMIVSHAGPIKIILLEALGISDKHLFQWHLTTASLTVLKQDEGFFQLMMFNGGLWSAKNVLW